ncbi:glycosyltransferase family 4 protein [Methanoregula sp. UBA64]|jgi:L-malate glycosyltransferase|uniref:glycosyltransferase family 4 protein n=1 Tax=Methanoregula sp. UBA64 TaxID=1915554 RepID=UPI0025EF1915|nr:glycosyltransferase family 4 protein [Methanoregula sp. UBA64]
MILLLIADGRSIHTQRWAEYFAERGHGVHLVTYNPMNRTIPGVTEYVLTSRWDNLYLSFIPRHLAVKRLVRQLHPDLIHAHFIAKYGFHLPGLGRCPSVVSAWGDDILILPKKSRLIAWYTKRVMEDADLVYAISKNIREHIIEDFAIPGQKVRYLPFGIDTGIFSPPQNTKPDAIRRIEVFSNRGYFPVYDNATLVRGFALAFQKNPALRLTLKGDGPLEQSVREEVTSLGLSGVVTFMGKTDYLDVPNDYRRADIFITTSVSDGTPVSLLEAMASGLPCIATSVGGIPEWVETGKTGLLIPPSSPEAVAEALLLFATDPVLRSLMGSAARDAVIRNGQWKTLMAQAEKDYLALIKTYSQDRS